MTALSPIEAIQDSNPRILGGEGNPGTTFITYWFAWLPDTGPINDDDPDWRLEEQWTTTEIANIELAMAEVETFLDVIFLETTSNAGYWENSVDLTFVKNDNEDTFGEVDIGYTALSDYIADVRINHTLDGRWAGDGHTKGGQGYEDLLKLLGDALGLGLPHNSYALDGSTDVLSGMSDANRFTTGPDGLNDPINTVMAENDGWFTQGTSQQAYGNRATFGAWDIQALINEYGASDYNIGNDTYVLPGGTGIGTYFSTLYDTGGVDEIVSNSTTGAVIDIRAATNDYNTETSGGPVSYVNHATPVGGFTIAQGTLIENATGGAGNDTIRGNALDNFLNGNAGDDSMVGDLGADTLLGGIGDDRMFGGDGNDVFQFGVSGAERNVLGGERDTLDGGADHDKIVLYSFGTPRSWDLTDFDMRSIEEVAFDGQRSGHTSVRLANREMDQADELSANLVINGHDGRVVEDLDITTHTLIVDVEAIHSTDVNMSGWTFQNWTSFDDIQINGDASSNAITATSQADLIYGFSGDDVIAALDGDDTLIGDIGNDTLNGGLGDDSMLGGDDDDTYYVERAGDVALEFANQGNDRIISAISYTLDDHFEELQLAGTAGEGTGNSLSNLMIASTSGSYLSGLGGNDTLIGDAGFDFLTGGAGADSMSGGDNADAFRYVQGESGSGDTLNGGAGIDKILLEVDGSSSQTFDMTAITTISVEAIEFGGRSTGSTTVLLYNDMPSTLLIDGNTGVVGGTPLDTVRMIVNSGIGENADLRNWTFQDWQDIDKIEVIGNTNANQLIGTSEGDLLEGANGNDTLFGQDGNDALMGGGDNDQLIGSGGDDTLNGGIGADSMWGGADDDQYWIYDATDMAFEQAGEGQDHVLSFVSWTLGDHFEDLDIYDTAITANGNAENNSIRANALNNILNGYGGDDTLFGADGDDTMYGGTGDDTFRFTASFGTQSDTFLGGGDHDRVLLDSFGSGSDTFDLSGINVTDIEEIEFGTKTSGTATLLMSNKELDSASEFATNLLIDGSGALGIDVLRVTMDAVFGTVGFDAWTFEDWQVEDRLEVIGHSGSEVITGASVTNHIQGGLGDDTITGSANADTLDGGADDDTASYLHSGALVVVNLNNGVAVGGHAQGDTLIDIEHVTGSAYDDRLTGDAGANALLGGGGGDLLAGLDDNDVLEGGTGQDSLAGGNGDDTLRGGADDDRLFGNNNNDYIEGGGGDDFTNGGNGDDTILGGADDDNVLVGGSGADSISGDGGNDGLNGSFGDDTLMGGTGEDRLFGGTGDDSLVGGSENDIIGGMGDQDTLEGGSGDDGLNGGGGNDVLRGDAGVDRLFGGTGDDTLVGGEDDDLLIGQSGVDTYVFEAGWGQDRISGYGLDLTGQPRVDEVIDLSALGITFAELTIQTQGTGTLIYVTADGAAENSIEVLFRGPSELTIDDFFFGL